jgi:hypothetical protein
MGGPNGYRATRPVLAIDVVKHVGDRVAFVVAETAAQALDALEHARVRLLGRMSQSAFRNNCGRDLLETSFSGDDPERSIKMYRGIKA